MTTGRASSAVEPGSASDARASERFVYSTSDVGDTEGYSHAVAGVSIEAIRAGETVRPGTVQSTRSERFVSTSAQIGFQMLTQTTIAADHLALARIDSVPPEGSRWCEIDLQPGTLLAYSPEAEHTAINRPGLAFTFVLCELETLEETARLLGITPAFPARGEVHKLHNSPLTNGAANALSTVREANRTQPDITTRLSDEVLGAICRAFTEESRLRTGAGRRIDSRQVVRDCTEYAESLDRIPSNAELCMIAHVSERRLRQAFSDQFNLPPTHYFRLWALQRAHDRLAGSSPQDLSVTSVAAHLGFLHLGRFAGHYKRVYGRSPSQTLRMSAQAPATLSR